MQELEDEVWLFGSGRGERARLESRLSRSTGGRKVVDILIRHFFMVGFRFLILYLHLLGANGSRLHINQSLEDKKALCRNFFLIPFSLRLDILVAFIVAAIFACCMYLRYKICPDEDEMFTDLQLEEIRLERVSEKEKTLLGRMSQMKVCLLNSFLLELIDTQQKLSDIRKKKTNIETRRDITKVVEERLDTFNEKGRSVVTFSTRISLFPSREELNYFIYLFILDKYMVQHGMVKMEVFLLGIYPPFDLPETPRC
jgi:hypothetical protein